MRLSVLSLLLASASLTAAVPVRSQDAATSPYLTALQAQFDVVDLAQGDLDGDGKDETAVCFKVPDDDGLQGGFAVLSSPGALAQVQTQLFIRDGHCERVKIKGRKVGIQLVGGTLKKPKTLVFTYGKTLAFRSEDGHVLHGAEVTSSLASSLDGHPNVAVLDGNARTSWAEAEQGTAIGEELTLTFQAPFHVGYVAVVPGHGQSERSFRDHNRLHRGSFRAQTPADLGDAAAGIDFEALGLEAGGDRVRFTVENQPSVAFIKLDKANVSRLKLRIESVYLGNRKDDTHIAEVEPIPAFTVDELIQGKRPVPVAVKTTAPQGDDQPASNLPPAPPPHVDDGSKSKSALDALDKAENPLLSGDDW